MSGQLLELIIYAAIALFVINKLIATLGVTSEDDPSKSKSFFGERSIIKDVTPINKKANILRPNFVKKAKVNLKGLIVSEHESEIETGLIEVIRKLPSFNLEKFINGAKSAFKMIINASINNNEAELGKLVDKRYIEQFKTIALDYDGYDTADFELNAQISEIYTFGNNIFIKILFAGKNITNKVKELHEEWTFTKSVLNTTPEWYLTNIDKA